MRHISRSQVLSFIAVAFLACRAEPREPEAGAADSVPADARTAIVVPASARAMILEEMRVMLGALSRFLSGAAAADTAVMRAAAETAGLKSAVDVNPEVSRLLPAEFLEIGEGTHIGFDSLATLVSQGAKQEVLLGRLSGIMSRCVSCHSTYRLEVAP
jgi:cytochrome c556